jgi:site-specific DNA-methyltransferase (cytosine-N4-specific)
LSLTLLVGDCRDRLGELDADSVQSCVTSPPYFGLRDYGVSGQIGAEMALDAYLNHLCDVFEAVRRVLRPDGTLWLNLGDSYTSGGRTWRDADKKNAARGMSYRPPTPAGLKPKDLIGVPWRLAFRLQEMGWYLRTDIVWHKPNCQPESVRDRPTRAHEFLFLLTLNERYYYDHAAARETSPTTGKPRNRRTVWNVNTEPYPEAHFAVFPASLVRPCILAGSRPGDTILDPFFGSGTVGEVCRELGRDCIGIELNPDYAEIARRRNA